jgi:hypothetical protein
VLPCASARIDAASCRELRRPSFTLQHVRTSSSLKTRPRRAPSPACVPARADRAARRHQGWQPRRALGPAGYTPNQALPHLPLHPPKLTDVPATPTEPPPRRCPSRGGHRRWPPALPRRPSPCPIRAPESVP